MNGSDLLAALTPVLDVLTRLGVRHFVGGSVASSAHGIARASLDVDVVAELDALHVGRLVAALQDAYFVDETRVHAAVESKRSFNLIHLATMFSVDVFVAKARAFDRSQLARRQLLLLSEEPERYAYVASAEDTILAKLEWYRLGGGVADRQWRDVLGVIMVQGERLDLVYLRTMAAQLAVSDLLEQALQAAGTQR